MYIIYDARHFEDYYSGLSRYSFSVLDELIKSGNFKKLDIILNSSYDYTNNPLFLQIQSKINSKKNINLIYLDAPIFSFKHNFSVSQYINSTNCNIYFYPHFDIPILIRKKSIFVVHDLFALILDDYILKYSFLKKIYLKTILNISLMKKNTKCVAVSETTKQDIIKFFGIKFNNKITVIYEDSFSDTEEEPNTENSLPNLIYEERYLLYIGGRRKHKNLKQMIDIFQILVEKENYDGYFIIAGSKKNFDFNVEEYIYNKKNIISIGQVSDWELNILYKNMEALFFLSKYEGFGLPIVEASKYNKKIITSNLGACKEIAPENALMLDIDNKNDILANRITKYLCGKERINNKKYFKKFSWQNTVKYITSMAVSN